MKIGVYSHCTIDSIVSGDSTYETAGGPACYCSLTARNQRFDVNLVTKYGKDFPLSQFLEKNKIKMQDPLSLKNTTRFKIVLNDSDRDLFIENKCEPLEFVDEGADGIIISPVFDEIPAQTFEKIKSSCNFVLLDPQGFIRTHDTNNKISLKNAELSLDNITAIKVNPEELFALTGLSLIHI